MNSNDVHFDSEDFVDSFAQSTQTIKELLNTLLVEVKEPYAESITIKQLMQKFRKVELCVSNYRHVAADPDLYPKGFLELARRNLAKASDDLSELVDPNGESDEFDERIHALLGTDSLRQSFIGCRMYLESLKKQKFLNLDEYNRVVAVLDEVVEKANERQG